MENDEVVLYGMIFIMDYEEEIKVENWSDNYARYLNNE